MKTGFVILNYNSWKQTRALAVKVASFASIDRIIVVDNDSTDDSLSHLETLESNKITVYETGRNGGYSFGNNVGARILSKEGVEIVFFSNPDVDINEDSIIKVIEAFHSKEYSVISCVEHDSSDIVVKPAFWNLPSYLNDLRDCFLIGRLKSKNNNNNNIIDPNVRIQTVPVIKGSFLATKLYDFFDVGGFDENVFLYCEERILAKKMADKGYRLGIVTDSKFNHNHSASIEKTYSSAAKRVKILYQSRLYYNIKYNHINVFQRTVLKIAMKYSLVEYIVIGIMKQIKK